MHLCLVRPTGRYLDALINISGKANRLHPLAILFAEDKDSEENLLGKFANFSYMDQK